MASKAWDDLAGHKYMSMATFKKNGEKVAIPVWLVADGGALYVWTDPDSFKAKRLRNNGACELTPCNATGKKLLGETVKGKGSFVDGDEMVRIVGKFVDKYGWQYHMMSFVNRVLRGIGTMTVAKILPA